MNFNNDKISIGNVILVNSHKNRIAVIEKYRLILLEKCKDQLLVEKNAVESLAIIFEHLFHTLACKVYAAFHCSQWYLHLFSYFFIFVAGNKH